MTFRPQARGKGQASDVGAVEAVRIAHRVGKVKIIGWDISPDEVDAQ